MGSCCGADKEKKEAAKDAGTIGSRLLGLVDALCERLEAWPVLAVAAACLAASFFCGGGHGHCGGGEGAEAWGWKDPALATLVLCGIGVAKEAFVALLLEKRIRAALLITTAMVACVATGQLFAAGEVAFIMALGEKLEAFTTRRAKKGLQRLVGLVPQTARKVQTCPHCIARGELFKEVQLEEIAAGDAVRVLPGETIPADGRVEEGETSVDQSVMTGESLPVDKTAGDEVYSGTVNRYGAITVRVTKAPEDSALQKLVRLVAEADKKKAPMQRIADKWAAILVPVSMGISILTFFGVWAWGGDVHTALLRAVTIMVVFCPCALALATPTSIMAAIGQAAKFGVIVKSGEALETMGRTDVACIDKTGTVTTGKPGVTDVAGEETLYLAQAVEASSEHPLAKAICQGAARECDAFRMSPGKGVAGIVDGREVFCGTEAWLEENGVAPVQEDLREKIDALRKEGKAVVLVAADGKVTGYIALADTVRDGAKEALAELPEAGLRAVLLTGDNEATARHVAEATGIGEVRAELLPEEKAAAIEELQKKGCCVCMIGDGVNDALALKTADVGIAMGGAGADIAVEAADIALTGDELAKIAYLKRLSSACVRLIKLNITISMCINFVAICLSILGVLTPVTGALVHNAGSCLVVLNGALLYDRDYRTKGGRGKR